MRTTICMHKTTIGSLIVGVDMLIQRDAYYLRLFSVREGLNSHGDGIE